MFSKLENRNNSIFIDHGCLPPLTMLSHAKSADKKTSVTIRIDIYLESVRLFVCGGLVYK
ncbi:hypothetical protein AY491_07205 [Corynebacterium diphtheriae bv. gravis]|nr:hypothetical protein AY491_07205 [Corynebacterium diphtheriae bv. gravis]